VLHDGKLDLMQRQEFLGLLWDSVTMCVRLPARRLV
jgi:hypothetical protein